MNYPTSSINVQIYEPNPAEALWSNFHSKTNEMIISKNGRKMFPNIEFKVSELQAEIVYVFLLKFTSDKNRYRYSCQEWSSSKNDKFKDSEDVILHSDGAQNGQKWMDHPVSFDFIRLTNCPRNKNANIVYLQSLHKYRPVLEIYSIPDGVSNGNISMTEFNEIQEKIRVYNSGFELMEFIAVTAYQNKEVNDLKKANNKYASAFNAKETKERERKQAELMVSEGNIKQGLSNPFMHGQPPYPPFFNYPSYFWNNPAAMMGQFASFGQMPNQFAPGPTAPTGMGNMPNPFGTMPAFPGPMPNMNIHSTAQWQQNPTAIASQACSSQAPPTFAAQAYQMTQACLPPFTPPTQVTPGIHQAPPLTPTSSNQSTSSTSASPVEPVAQNQMTWHQHFQNYGQNIPNMMNNGQVPQGKLRLDLQNNFSNLQSQYNYTSNPVNNQNNVL